MTDFIGNKKVSLSTVYMSTINVYYMCGICLTSERHF